MRPKDETVLVTGAGGSIGTAICRELARKWGCRVVALDCDDTALHDLAIRMEAVPTSRVEYVLHDVVDDFGVAIRRRRKITTVIHAAAIKHVGIAEFSHWRAERVNLDGTGRALALARSRGARFLLVSTDKAASARCWMGKTKRLAERTVVEDCGGCAWCGVFRLGNVWWSRGSVLPTWDARRRFGLPLPCARGVVTRFGMFVGEAASCIVSCLYPLVEIPTKSIVVPAVMSRWKLRDLARAYRRLHPDARFAWRDLPSHENAHELLFQAEEIARVYAHYGRKYSGPPGSDAVGPHRSLVVAELKHIADGAPRTD